MKKIVFAMAALELFFHSGCIHNDSRSRPEDLGAKQYFAAVSVDFVFLGNVIDENSHEPIAHAKLFFIDTGLRMPRTSRDWISLVGTAGSDGAVDQRYRYGWIVQGKFDAQFPVPPHLEGMNRYDVRSTAFPVPITDIMNSGLRQTFAVEIRKEGFVTKRIEFAIDTLPEDSQPSSVNLGTYPVNIGTIALEHAAEETISDR